MRRGEKWEETRRKLSFWDRNGGLLSLIKNIAVGEVVVKYC